MTRVLVPVAVLEGETVSPGLMSLLGTVDVTVLGHHVLPEQTPPDQARLQFEERATAALEDLSEEFRAAGGAADHRLVFTHDREQTVQRVADEVGANALAVSRPTGDVERVLVSLSGDVDADRILSFVETLVGDRDVGVTLFLAAGAEMPDEAATDDAATDDADPTDATDPGVADEQNGAADGSDGDEARLEAAADRLREAGIDATTERATEGSAFDALIDAAAGHDAVVMGERAPSFRSFFFGDESGRVAAASVGPVLVVRNRPEPAEGDADATPDGEE
ncbi:universal stress protein UspA [Halorubrum salipaludis]|uniref:Universal stress protein UspA n=1 Tax=Halorubrum salipaludis TaxID=2032630 RepID=A0A2A2FJB8_9EURY|nr:universal stress protein [Halorubrum salipaludis]PAU84854.1 universal stress protein UspA [Halorubrum salipaludis]